MYFGSVEKLNDFDQNQLNQKSFPVNSNILVIFVSVLPYVSKLKMKLQTECTLLQYLFWRARPFR